MPSLAKLRRLEAKMKTPDEGQRGVEAAEADVTLTHGVLWGVDCVRLRVDTIEDGLRFYRDRLGHELIWRTDTAAGLRLPGSAAELVLYTDDQSEAVDFKVDAVEAALATMLEAGAELVTGPFDVAIGRGVVVRDPCGNELVLLDSSKGQLLVDDQGRVTGVG